MDAHARIQLAANGATLEITFPNGPPLYVHPLWLRERVRGAMHLDPLTEQRLYNPSDLSPAEHITNIAQPAPGQFVVTFTDGVQGRFTTAEILSELPTGADPTLPPERPWNTQTPAPEPHDWRGCETPGAEHAVLQDYLANGYVILTNVPTTEGAVLQVARRFGYVRETNFGTLFDVRSVPAATDLAYTALKLDPHTDNPYRHPVPGIQLLHCLANRAPGGLSTLVDGLAVAETLRRESPEAFASLTNTPIRFRYTDATTELNATAPLIELRPRGQVAAIHYSPRLDATPLLPAPELEIFFAARRLLDRLLRSDRFERRFRLDEGHLMMFNNRRLLHGRTGFDPNAGLRHLQGCYIDADGPASRYRVLHRSQL
jgi:gamma-butyrobetaine dioxygenase